MSAPEDGTSGSGSMLTTFNSNTLNKRKAAERLMSAITSKSSLVHHLQAVLEVQVHPSDPHKRRKRAGSDAAATGERRYEGVVTIKGRANSIKLFQPGTVHIIDVHRIKLNTDDLHGDGVHSNVLVIWPDGSVDRYDPFSSEGSQQAGDMQDFLDSVLSEWVQSLSVEEISYKGRLVSPPMLHGPQFVEYMNGLERTAGEHFCYMWCVLLVVELCLGATTLQEAHRRMLASMDISDISTQRISMEDSDRYLAAIRSLVRRHGLG